MAFEAKLPDPIEVTTPNQGVVTLRWITIGSMAKLDKLADKHGATEEFVVRALHAQLLSPRPSLDEFRSWSAADRAAIAVAWAAHPLGFNRPIDPNDLAGSFATAFRAYSKETLEKINDTVRHGVDLMARFQQQVVGPGAAAMVAHLEAVRRVERSWQNDLLRAAQQISVGVELQRRIQQRAFVEVAAQIRTGLVLDMTAAVVANQRLLGMSSLMATMTEGFRAVSEHQAAMAARLADAAASVRPALLALTQRVDSIANAARAVFVDWERRAIPPTSSWLQEAPGIEVFSASRAAAVVAGSATDSDPAAPVQRLELAALRVEPLLIRVNPNLITMYQGATAVITRGGPDAPRHLAVSLRELLTHAMHLLAPDDELEKWSGTRPEDYHNGRPTRRLRLRYIFRALEGTSYYEFVVADVDGAIEMMDMLNGDTHRLVGQLTTEAQRMVLRRVEGVLAMLLEARFGKD